MLVTERFIVDPFGIGGGLLGGAVVADDPLPPQANAVAESNRATPRAARPLAYELRMISSFQ